MPASKPAVGFIVVTVLLDVIGFGLLIPVGPRLVQELGKVSEPDAAPIVGWLGATFAICQFFFAPILGSLSDRFGRRPVLLVALLGSGLDYFAMALAPTLWVLFVTRALNGTSGASFTVCNAYIADVTPPQKRAAAYGLLGAAFGIGFVIGPLMGGLLGGVDIRLPFWVAGGLTLVNWLYGWFVLPESLPSERRRSFSLARANPVGALRHLRVHPRVLGLAGVLFFANMAQFALHATWVLYTSYKFKWGPTATALSLTAVGVGAALVQGGLARKIIPRLGEPLSVWLGMGLGVFVYAAYAWAPVWWVIYVAIAFGSLSGVAGPAVQAIVSKSVPLTEQGEVQGALAGMASITTVIGYVAGGYIFRTFTGADAGWHIPGATLYFSSIMLALGFLLSLYVLKGVPAHMGQTTGHAPGTKGA